MKGSDVIKLYFQSSNGGEREIGNPTTYGDAYNMNGILGLKNLKLNEIDVIFTEDEWYDPDDCRSYNLSEDGYVRYDFSFDKRKMKQFEKYLDLSWANDSDKQLILNSFVSDFSMYSNSDKITFRPCCFDDVYAIVSQDILNELMELVNNRFQLFYGTNVEYRVLTHKNETELEIKGDSIRSYLCASLEFDINGKFTGFVISD